jgi:hypothetical protein
VHVGQPWEFAGEEGEKSTSARPDRRPPSEGRRSTRPSDLRRDRLVAGVVPAQSSVPELVPLPGLLALTGWIPHAPQIRPASSLVRLSSSFGTVLGTFLVIWVCTGRFHRGLCSLLGNVFDSASVISRITEFLCLGICYLMDFSSFCSCPSRMLCRASRRRTPDMALFGFFLGTD